MTGKSLSERIGDFGHRLAIEGHAAWLAARDPRVPWFARILAVAVAAYALSPIDLIPDFMPVLGWLDDLVIVPLDRTPRRRRSRKRAPVEPRRHGVHPAVVGRAALYRLWGRADVALALRGAQVGLG